MYGGAGARSPQYPQVPSPQHQELLHAIAEGYVRRGAPGRGIGEGVGAVRAVVVAEAEVCGVHVLVQVPVALLHLIYGRVAMPHHSYRAAQLFGEPFRVFFDQPESLCLLCKLLVVVVGVKAYIEALIPKVAEPIPVQCISGGTGQKIE